VISFRWTEAKVRNYRMCANTAFNPMSKLAVVKNAPSMGEEMKMVEEIL